MKDKTGAKIADEVKQRKSELGEVNKVEVNKDGANKEAANKDGVVGNARGRSKALSSEEIKKIKLKAREFEKDNNSKLLVFASSNGWWKMGGNSALIYAHILARELDLPSEPRVRIDKDLYGRFFDGVVSISNINQLSERLKGIGIEIEEHDDTHVVFALTKAIPDDELEVIRNIREEAIKKINQTIPVAVIYPQILIMQRKVALKFRSLLAAAGKVDADICLTELARMAWRDVVLLGAMSRKYEAPYATLRRIFRDNEEAEINVQLLVDADVIVPNEALKIITMLEDVNTAITAEGKKLKNGAKGGKKQQ